MGETVDIIVARIDERTQNMEKNFEELKTDFKTFMTDCRGKRKEIHERVDKVLKNNNSSLSGRDKAIVYGTAITAISSLIATIIMRGS